MARYFRKNVGGQWKVCELTKEEVLAIQDKVIEIGLGKLNKIRKVADEHKIALTDACTAVILDKAMPSFESLANDVIEGSLKDKDSNKGPAQV